MILKKIHFAIDKTTKANASQKILLKRYRNYSPQQSDIIAVIGGDGFMLETLKKYRKYNKPFYGMNRGTSGFLMNKFKTKNIRKSISKAKLVSISALEMHTITKDKIKKSAIAINEVSLLRQSRQAASLRILNGKKILIKKLIGDGVLVSTPAGSTAYNLSVYGPILSLNSIKIAITRKSPFRPRWWKGALLPEKTKINFYVNNSEIRSSSVAADHNEFRNIKEVEITSSNDLTCTILFDNNHSMEERILKEQFFS